MTATLEQIREDPSIIERAIAEGTLLEIVQAGRIAAKLTPTAHLSKDEARQAMRALFAKPAWQFEVGEPMSRDERNARG